MIEEEEKEEKNKLLSLPFHGQCLMEVLQSLHGYNPVWGLPIHIRLINLSLFQGNRCVTIIN